MVSSLQTILDDIEDAERRVTRTRRAYRHAALIGAVSVAIGIGFLVWAYASIGDGPQVGGFVCAGGFTLFVGAFWASELVSDYDKDDAEDLLIAARRAHRDHLLSLGEQT